MSHVVLNDCVPVAKWFCGINSAPLFVGVFGDTILPNTQRLFFKNLPLKGGRVGVNPVHRDYLILTLGFMFFCVCLPLFQSRASGLFVSYLRNCPSGTASAIRFNPVYRDYLILTWSLSMRVAP
jgi:hypothetical protein